MNEAYKRIAEAYEALPLFDPMARGSYCELAKQVREQFATIPVKVTFTEEDPYHTSAELFAALERGEFRVYSGSSGHPMLSEQENILFRAVHDYYGHYLNRANFSAAGERIAWRAHLAMLTGIAGAALTTETLGQNSWFYYGPRSSERPRPYAIQKAALLPETVYSNLIRGDV